MAPKVFAICVFTILVHTISSNGALESKIDHLQQFIKKFEKQQAELELENEKLKEKVDENRKMITSLKAMNVTSIGTTYIRWGRTECPATSQLVYSGYAAKSYFEHGGGVDYQCLHPEPEWPTGATEGNQHYSYIYGVEYQVNADWSEDADNQDAPCALCNVESRTRQVMIPARETCPEGWVREYYGFLVAQHHDQWSSTFVCLDKDFEYLPGGTDNVNGGLFYMVESICGSLPCPPYDGGMELACVVCTK